MTSWEILIYTYRNLRTDQSRWEAREERCEGQVAPSAELPFTALHSATCGGSQVYQRISWLTTIDWYLSPESKQISMSNCNYWRELYQFATLSLPVWTVHYTRGQEGASLTLSVWVSIMTDSCAEPLELPLIKEVCLVTLPWWWWGLLLFCSRDRGIFSLCSSRVRSSIRSLITRTSLLFKSGCRSSLSSSWKYKIRPLLTSSC